MRSFRVHRHVRVGDIRFGMSRDAVEALLGVPESSLPPGPFTGDSTLFYGSSTLAIFVDGQGHVCAIESRGCPFFLEGKDLRAMSWSSLKKHVFSLDPGAVVGNDGASITSRILGVSANTEDDESPQGIIAFQPGYFDRPQRDAPDMSAWLAAIAGAQRPNPQDD